VQKEQLRRAWRATSLGPGLKDEKPPEKKQFEAEVWEQMRGDAEMAGGLVNCYAQV
jgi:hypothetical protein